MHCGLDGFMLFKQYVSCKTWCLENQIPASTMGYWMRRLRNTENPCETDMIFAKMPTEQEISAKEYSGSVVKTQI